MSLPQRKKSAEEIAKLRESLGIPGQPPGEGPPPAETTPPDPVEPSAEAEVKVADAPEEKALPVEKEEPVAKKKKKDSVSEIPKEEDVPVIKEEAVPAPEPEIAPVPAPTPALEPLPVGEAPAPRQVRSLRRSERIPVLPVDDDAADTAEPRPESTIPGKTVLPALQVARPVRSLKKSEQLPVEHHDAAADSKLPQHRHSDKELGEIRRREAIAQVTSHAPPKPMVAHLAMVIPGYVAAIAGGVSFHYYEFAIGVTATFVGIALLVAGFIFLKRPLSRHHAAFIAVMTLFVIVFGALYYFPQLQHGT